jgi:hypothetical protein
VDQSLPHPYREGVFSRADRSRQDQPRISRAMEHPVPVELEAIMSAITGEATFQLLNF